MKQAVDEETNQPDNSFCMKDELADLLNRVMAICTSGAGAYKELAVYLGCHRQEIYRWIVRRTQAPKIETESRIRTWTARKELAISASSGPTQSAYRSHYRLACERWPTTRRRFPVDGRKAKP